MNPCETELAAAVREFLDINRQSTRLAVELSQHGYRNTAPDQANRIFAATTSAHLRLTVALAAYDVPLEAIRAGHEARVVGAVAPVTSAPGFDGRCHRMSVPGDV